MNVFEAVKENITTRQATESYGIHVRRNGMAVCPFHNDKNPSMKVDKRFHCFGCQADGDVIDFVARLYGLNLKEAAEKLAHDFSISYDSKGRASPNPVKRQLFEEQRFRQTVVKCFRVCSDYHQLLKQWKTEYAPHSPEEEWNPLFVEALQKQSYVEYLLDILLFGGAQEKAALIAGQGKEVTALEQRITELATRATGSIAAVAGCNGAGAEQRRNQTDAGGNTERKRKEQHQELSDRIAA